MNIIAATTLMGQECYKCLAEQHFNSHLLKFAYILLQLKIVKSSLIPDADAELLSKLYGTAF